MSGQHPAPSVVVSLLGPITVSDGLDELLVPARLDRTVLAHLALAEGRSLSVDMLIEALWGQHPPRGARNALQVKVSRLRRRLGPHGRALEFNQGSYRLDLGRHQVDVGAFADHVAAARERLGSDDVESARSALEAALALWRGSPLAELDEHPRLVAARARLDDLWMTTQELMAGVELRTGAPRAETFDRLRKVLDRDPLRASARLLLMQALERSGRRAEALAVYDAGRRVLADESGLTPPAALQEAFEALLAEERSAARRATCHEVTRAAPPGAIATARWLASEGEPLAAMRLAIRGAWWWWFGGARSEGRDLFEDLIGTAAGTAVERVESPDGLQAAAWLSVFRASEADAVEAIARGEDALGRAHAFGWTRHEALAAALLAERLYQRGEHTRATALLRASHQQFADDADAWGTAVAGVIAAKATMLRGDISRAGEAARALVTEFDELGDSAGQVLALDVAGYCAEIRGDLPSAARLHRRALALARRSRAPEWEAAQLTRIGSILALTGEPDASATISEAADIAASVGSDASLALARNALGLSLSLSGDIERSVASHEACLEWYERQGSRAGVSYTAGRLACETADEQPERARQLAERSAALAAETGDPRAVAHGLEAVARVGGDPVRTARALGGARALRRHTRAPLPAALNEPLLRTERRLAEQLGDGLLRELRIGARQVTGLATPDTVARWT